MILLTAAMLIAAQDPENVRAFAAARFSPEIIAQWQRPAEDRCSRSYSPVECRPSYAFPIPTGYGEPLPPGWKSPRAATNR